MLRRLNLNILKRAVKPNVNHFRLVTTTVNENQIPEKWDLLCGICLERKPVISKQMNEIEGTFKNLLNEIELENSMKSDHELRKQADKRRADMFKEGKVSNEDLDKSIGESAGEFEDNSAKEINSFVCAPRITEADEKNDTKSTERSLDKHLLFIINETLGNDNYWILPHGIRNDGETLRQTAERILKEKCGDIKVRFYGNAPCGFYKYKYPLQLRKENDVIGAKIFYFKMQYLDGEININDKTEFSWATRNELKDQLKPTYYKNIKLFLIDDED